MNFTVIQPPYAHDAAKIGESVAWEINALAKCGPDADVIVLPEAADHQGAVSTPEEVAEAFAKFHAPLLDACAETARRCNAVVFVNALDPSSAGFRNTTFAFGRDGALVGSGEWDEALLRKVIGLIDDYDARRHVYFMATADALQRQLSRLAPDIPRCQGEGFWKDGSGDIVDHAITNDYQPIAAATGLK